MKELHSQTSHKDLSLANRKSKSISDHPKKTLKTAKKNLNPELLTTVESAPLPELPKEPVDFPLISEAVDDYQFGESTESFVFPLLPETSTSSENSVLSDLTSVSPGIASEMYTTGTLSTYQRQNVEADSSVDAELAIKHLQQAQLKVMNSTDMDLLSKKLLDAIVHAVVQELCCLPKEKKCSNLLILKKHLLVPMIFLLCVVAVFFGSLLTSSGTQPFLGALPT